MNSDSEGDSNPLADSATWKELGWPPVAGRIQGWFQSPAQEQSNREHSIRLEERRRERARIARELHDTLFQGFLGASMVLQTAVEGMPADSPSKPSLSNALLLMRRVIDEGRSALQGLRSPATECTSLEQSIAELRDTLLNGSAKFRICAMGHPKPLHPGIQEQVFLIVREALANASRHSGASLIEVEIEYLPGRLRLVVRDDGSGIDREVLRSGRVSHWGLQGMRERAQSIGAQLRILSRKGAGTEVQVCVPDHAGSNGNGHA